MIRARAVPAALPFLLIGAVAAAAVLPGPGADLLPLLTLGPAAAAVSGSVWYTVIIGGVADAVCTGVDAFQGLLGSPRQATSLGAVLGVTVAGVVISAGRQGRRRELEDVRIIAEVAQRVLLRPVPPDLASPLRIEVRYISATSRARIGGDLYEVMASSPGVRLIIGDVQGRGLAAVKTAASVLATFREACPDADSLAAVADRIETSLARDLTDEGFVTAILAEIAADGSAISLMNCGHPPPLHLSATAAGFAEPARAALPLGLAWLAPQAREMTRLAIRPGDRLLFYTDGISEARNRSGEYFPLERCHALREAVDPASALDRLGKEVIRHVGHALDDDAALLLVQRDDA